MPMGGELGIRAGEVWGYKLRLSGPLVPARVVKPGAHYDASIEILILEGPTRGTRMWARRARLPCKWETREEWLSDHPDFSRSLPVSREGDDPFELPADVLFGMGEAALRRVVREEMQAVLNVPPKIAYTRREAAQAVGLSESSLSGAVQRSELFPSYYNSKALFTPDELRRWIETLPDEPS